MSALNNSENEPTRSIKPITIGTEIGQYILKRVIASGGMGTVYEAQQKNPRRTVAVKVIKGSLATEGSIRRLEYEAQLLARLRHPGIAQIYEAGSYNDEATSVPFFAMEYIPNAKGITDYAVLKQLNVRERLELFLQVCDAVHHGHQRGIVHRDLKPSNVLVDSNGRVRIIDFGVARATDSDMKQAAAQTEVGQIVGSIQYMSPEQFEADPNDIDTRSDIYALGLVLYELLSRTLPYASDSEKIFNFAAEVREGNLIPLGSRDKSFKGELEAIVHKALQRDRENRYQSAFGLAQDIRRYLAGDAVIARPPGISYQFRVFARRNKAIIGVFAAAFVLLLSGIIVTTSLLLRVNQERQKAEIASRRATAGQTFLAEVLHSAFPPGYGDKATVLDVIDRASQKLNNAFPDDPEIEADLRTSLSRAYKNVSHWDQAQRELNIALELNTRTRGKTSDQTLAVRKELALIYHIIDDRGAKLNNARAIEAAMNERYGASDLKTLDAQGDVVDALEDYGYHSEARKGSEELWSELKKRLGVDSASTLTEQIRYSWLLLESGRIEEAKEICGDAFERIKRQVHTENNILIKRAKCCLGAAYIIQGHIDSAETLYGMRKMPEQVGIEHVFQGEFDLDGEPFQLIVFFETWCPYSRRAMLRIRQVDRQYSQFGLKILGFTNSSPNDDVENYLEEQKISFAAFKENGRSWNYFGCEGTPAIRLLYRGYLIWEYYWPATDRIPTQMLEAMVSAQSCGIIQ